MNRRDFLITSTLSALMTVASHQFPGQAQTLYKSSKQYKDWKSNHKFLQGINAPVFQEVDIDNLQVTGEIPESLKGMYVRNGPNPMFKPSSYNYPLEGDGMLHGISFKEGKVSYRNRWIETRGLTYEMFEGKELAELKFKNYANTNIIAHGNKLLALYEIGLPYQVTPNLDTVGEWNFQGNLEHSMTAHPKEDPITGELHFYRYSFFNPPYLYYYIANSQGEIIRQSPIEIPKPVLLHDMALTKNYAIFFDCPFVFDMKKAQENKTPFNWKPEEGTTIILVDRNDPSRKPIYLKTEAFWVWHFMNAFENDKTVTIDFMHYPQVALASNWKDNFSIPSNLQRITIDLETQTINSQALDDRYADFPTIDQRKIGQPYQFGYAPYIDTKVLAKKGMPNYFPELIQYDMVNNTHQVHRFKPGCYGGEATFIPHPNSDSELEGYIVTLVFDEERNGSDLLIIDPGNFQRDPMATVHLPVRVPSGFHGNWITQTLS